MSVAKKYSDVTEIPGVLATMEQLSMIMTRYNLAKKFTHNKSVLEIACGSGFGLEYLAENALKLTACDIDFNLIQTAKKNIISNDKITLIQADAHNLPFENFSMDTIIIFEAIYYLSDINKFVNEVLRLLKTGGVLIISSVNCQWHGFNPSPYSTKYYTIDQLNSIFSSEHFTENKIFFSFDNKFTYKNMFISFLKIIAVKLHLIPKTMNGKKLLKKIFLGKLTEIPNLIYNGMAKIEPLIDSSYINQSDRKNYKQIYFITKKK
jgi:ubiquinone/menaquinone biosynthesis C-methylase UbiE